MALKIHRVVQNTQNVYHVLVLVLSDSEHHEVATFSPMARHMDGQNPPANFGPPFCAQDVRAFDTCFQCGRQGFGVRARLYLAKIRGCPSQDLP